MLSPITVHVHSATPAAPVLVFPATGVGSGRVETDADPERNPGSVCLPPYTCCYLPVVVARASDVRADVVGTGFTGLEADFFVAVFLDFFAVALVPDDAFFAA